MIEGPDETAARWQARYEAGDPEQLSWFEPSPERSLALIARAALDPASAAVIDVGGGTSHLAGELLDRGYADLTVVDVSAAALARARADLGERATAVRWLEADVRRLEPGRRFDLWHDRALFHFMVEKNDHAAYLESLGRVLRPGGYLVLATFGLAGPTSCSGLPVHRYGPAELDAALGPEFERLAAETAVHTTPGGAAQQFQYALLRRR